MAIRFNTHVTSNGSCSSQSYCLSKDGCPPGVCPDFVIRRHDTKPELKIFVEDCDGPIDLRGLIAEVNMWALACLKSAITDEDEYFRLADDVGFEQVMVGDVIVFDRVRLPEYMLVTGFDEENKLVKVQRGYHGTTPSSWKRGHRMRIFRIFNAPAQTELVYEDITDVDGSVERDVLSGAYLVYQWEPGDTCLPGCFWLEFKLLKMKDAVYFLPGGNWTGPTHTHTDDYFWTGTTHTDSSVKLSYNQIDEKYYIPSSPWSGELHLEEENYYTGTTHDDGSVILNKTGVASEDTVEYDSDSLSIQAVSVIPSFTNPSLTPSDFGCNLGDGVEWVRRFPLSGEGFLIKITPSPTSEL